MPYDIADIPIITAREAIRRRPAMYLGPEDDPLRFNRLVHEAVCLGLDEILTGHALQLRVVVGEAEVQVADNGRGLSMKTGEDGVPFAETLLTRMFACRESKESPEAAACCSIGLVVVVALSETFRVRNHRDGYSWVQEYRDGTALGPFRAEAPGSGSGLELTFWPDRSLVGPARFDPVAFDAWLRERFATQEPGAIAVDTRHTPLGVTFTIGRTGARKTAEDAGRRADP